MLATFRQHLMRFIRIVCWFKVTKQCILQCSPTGHISLDSIPSKCRSILQGYSILPLLDIILQIYKFEVRIKLMAEARDRGSVHSPSKAGGQLQFHSCRQSRGSSGLLI